MIGETGKKNGDHQLSLSRVRMCTVPEAELVLGCLRAGTGVGSEAVPRDCGGPGSCRQLGWPQRTWEHESATGELAGLWRNVSPSAGLTKHRGRPRSELGVLTGARTPAPRTAWAARVWAQVYERRACRVGRRCAGTSPVRQESRLEGAHPRRSGEGPPKRVIRGSGGHSAVDPLSRAHRLTPPLLGPQA